jgi:hypothetical protein
MRKSQIDHIREEAEAKQRGILWPDMLRAGRSVDGFLWKGDPRATPVQRAGLVLFGLIFLSFAAIGIALGCALDDWAGRTIGIVLGSLAGIAGVRFMRNAFRHVARQEKSHGASHMR